MFLLAEGRRNMNTGTEAMPGGTDWGAYTDASSDIRQVCLEARAAEFQVPTARAQMSCKDETMPYVRPSKTPCVIVASGGIRLCKLQVVQKQLSEAGSCLKAVFCIFSCNSSEF